MAKAEIEVLGKRYVVGCAPGEEALLAGLGARLDKRVREIERAAGSLGTERLLIAAALSFLDDIDAARAQNAGRTEDASRLEALTRQAETLAAEGQDD